MNNYLLKVQNTYRVETEADALKLREELRHNSNGELTAFQYTVKEIKQKGECIGSYIICKATLSFNSEKEPERHIIVSYDDE